MVAWLFALLIVPTQDPAPGPSVAPESPAPVTVPLPASPAEAHASAFVEPPKESAPIIPVGDERPLSFKLADRPESGPSLGGFLFGSGVVVALMVGAFLLLRRFGRGSRFLAGGGVINILARKPLGQKQEVFLVEVGARLFMIGSTREHLTTLGEFSSPDEVAQIRANLPGRREDSMRLAFRESLREGIKEGEEAAPERPYGSILGELAEIRNTVRAWRA